MTLKDLSDEEVMEILQEQLQDLRDLEISGAVFLLLKPYGATDTQWKWALKECGVEEAND